MKGKIKTLFTAILLTAVLLLSACVSENTGKSADRKCRVVLAESRYYTSGEYIKEVPRGDDAVFTLKFKNGYTFGEASYGNYDVQTSSPDISGVRTVSLTLHNVKYPTYVNVDVEKVAKSYAVSVKEADEFRCDDPVCVVDDGESATFTLWFDGDYTFESASAVNTQLRYYVTGIDGEVNDNNERRILLTVEDIKAKTVITVISRSADSGTTQLKPVKDAAVIGYDLNGGEYKNNELSGLYYTVNYLTHYPRPNTSIGTDVIKRDGYTLIGWNTKADGSGEHIGLGSRATVGKNEILQLYAEWAKWTDAGEFEFVTINRKDILSLYSEKNSKQQKIEELVERIDPSAEHSIVITSYRGNAEDLVIPAEIDGCSVGVIAPMAAAYNTRLKSVIFPDSMYYIMERSFVYCGNITEIYLFDNLHYIDYNAFGLQCPVKTIHLNAQLAPVYGMNESAQLANKIEYLMKNTENEKTVFFGSCSTWYGINVKIFREKTNRLTFNMGVEGDTCALFQLDLLKQYMRENDTLVYICDMGSPFLMLYDVTMDPRAYRLVEFNYDLLSTVDLTRYEKVISALNEYLVIKHNEISFGNAGTYEDCLGYISEYGDMEMTREGSTHNNIYTAVSPQVITEKDTFDKMKPVFQSFADMGIDIYFGFGTISEDAISDEIAVELNNLFVSGIKEKNIPVTLIAEFYTAILPSHLFYDYPYRLNSEGSYYYTQLFIDNFLYASSRNTI